MLKAMDGLKQAHMDVLVAVFGRSLLPRLPRNNQARAETSNHDPKTTGYPPSLRTRISLNNLGFP